MSKKTVYERIKDFSFEEMLNFLLTIRSDCTPADWPCRGDCKECLSMYLKSVVQDKITYIYVLPNEEIRDSFHITVKRKLFGDSVIEANAEFEKTFPHIKNAIVLRKSFEKASDGTAVYDSNYFSN